MGINKFGPLQGISWKFPAAHRASPFLTGLAVVVPVHFFCFLDCFLACHADTAGTSDKGVGEVFYGCDLFWFQCFIVPQHVVTLLESLVVHIPDTHFFQVQPEYSVNVSSSPSLKFYPVTDVPHVHGVVAPEDHLLSECLDSVLEVAGGEENISSDQLVLRSVHIFVQVLLPRKLDNGVALLHLNSDLFSAFGVDFVLHLTVQFFKDRSEIGAPPVVAGGQSEEDVEWTYILEFCYDVIFCSLPVFWRAFDLFKHRARILQSVGEASVRSSSPLALDTSEVGVGPEPFSFYEGHCSKYVARRLGESLVDIENSLLEIVLVGEFDSSLVVETKFSVREQSGPALDVPVFLVQEVYRFLTLARSKVEVGDLIPVIVQKYLRVAVYQGAVLAIVEVLSPDWVILDVFFFCFQCCLHVVFPFFVLFLGFSDCLIFQLCVHTVLCRQLSHFFFQVVNVIFIVQQLNFFGFQPGLVGVFAVVEFVVGVACMVQVLESGKDFLWSDLLLFLVSLVHFFPLQFDGDETSFIGQPRQLFDSIHDVGRSDRYTYHPSFSRGPARLLQQHELLEVDVVGDHVVLQFS